MSEKKSVDNKGFKIKLPRVRIIKNFPRLDPNDPFLLRKKAEAIKSLTETPLPEAILKRIKK